MWSVAALAEGRLSVLVFNDGASSVEAPLAVGAPAGTLFEGVTERRMVVIGGERGEGSPLKIEETPAAAVGTAWSGRVSLGAKQAAMYVFRLGAASSGSVGEGSPARRLARRQFVADAVLQKMDKGVVELRVDLPASALAASTRAYLHLVTEGAGELSVLLNGQRVFSGNTETPIRDVSVPPCLC